MARLQILELPTEHHGDDMTTPWLLVIDQVDEATADDIARWPDDIAKRTGARHVLCFSETVDIPANDTTAYLGAPAAKRKIVVKLGDQDTSAIAAEAVRRNPYGHA